MVTACTGTLADDETPAAAEPAREGASESAVALATVDPEDAADMTIAEVLRTDERLGRFRELAERAMTPVAPSWLDVWDWEAHRMGDDREGVTVFAPTDAAFEALDPTVLAALQDEDVDNEVLYDLLGHHYVHRLYPSEAFEPGAQRTWRRSPNAPVELTLDPATWGGHPIVQVDLRTANGYLHIIDGVVLPSSVQGASP